MGAYEAFHLAPVGYKQTETVRYGLMEAIWDRTVNPEVAGSNPVDPATFSV